MKKVADIIEFTAVTPHREGGKTILEGSINYNVSMEFSSREELEEKEKFALEYLTSAINDYFYEDIINALHKIRGDVCRQVRDPYGEIVKDIASLIDRINDNEKTY